MTVDTKALDEPTLALLAGVSKERGVEHFKIFERSVNIPKFKEYLVELRAANGVDKICIFMDNLSAHTSKKSKMALTKLGFRYIFNLPYAPQYNSIEFCFSKVKQKFRTLRA